MNFQPKNSIGIIFFFNVIEKKNYPSVFIVDNIQKMCLSFSTLKHIEIKDIQIALFLPDFFFKVYFQFLRLYINNSIFEQIKLYDSYEEINQDFALYLDEDIDNRIDKNLLRNANFFENIPDIKQNRNSVFKKNYFF